MVAFTQKEIGKLYVLHREDSAASALLEPYKDGIAHQLATIPNCDTTQRVSYF